MPAVITANNRASRDSIAPPPAVKENGDNYVYRMFYDRGQLIADSDSTAELLGLLIPDYEIMSAEEQNDARFFHARDIAFQARVNVLVDHYAELKDWEIAVLEYDEGTRFGWGDGTGTLGTLDEENPDIWTSKVKLALVDQEYTPYTEVPAPMSAQGEFIEDSTASNIAWIRPNNEEEYLRSLHRIGFIAFGRPGVVRK